MIPSAFLKPAVAPRPRVQHGGESYQLKDKRQAGLFASQQLLTASPEALGDNYNQ